MPKVLKETPKRSLSCLLCMCLLGVIVSTIISAIFVYWIANEVYTRVLSAENLILPPEDNHENIHSGPPQTFFQRVQTDLKDASLTVEQYIAKKVTCLKSII